MPSYQARTCSEPSSSRATTDAAFSSIPDAPVRWRALRTTAPPSWQKESTTRGLIQDPSNHTFSHGTDQARYLCWFLRRAFGLAGYEG